MPNSSLNEILASGVLNESAKEDIRGAFNARIAEERTLITAELREEFASKWEADKKQIVAAMDAIMKEAIKTELDEFKQENNSLIQERLKYKKGIKEHAKIVNQFANEILVEEMREFRKDRKDQKTNFRKLEEFVIKQLTEELTDLHTDKQQLAEQKVKLIKEGKAALKKAKVKFIEESAARVENIIDGVLRKEFIAMREDIQAAKENEFGRRIFEAFASEFLTSTLSENTQTGKLAKRIADMKNELDEANEALVRNDQLLREAQRKTRIAEDLSERKAIMSEMLEPLTPTQKDLMETVLESVTTSNLKKAFKKYLPSVLAETRGGTDREEPSRTRNQANTTRLVENRRDREMLREEKGNKVDKSIRAEHESSAEIIELKVLAGV